MQLASSCLWIFFCRFHTRFGRFSPGTPVSSYTLKLRLLPIFSCYSDSTLRVFVCGCLLDMLEHCSIRPLRLEHSFDWTCRVLQDLSIIIIIINWYLTFYFYFLFQTTDSAEYHVFKAVHKFVTINKRMITKVCAKLRSRNATTKKAACTVQVILTSKSITKKVILHSIQNFTENNLFLKLCMLCFIQTLMCK